jgi:CRP-like cAMP-binding protein
MRRDFSQPATAAVLDPIETRKPRVGVDLPVLVYTSDFAGPLHGRTRDLSVSGVCVATASMFAVKTVRNIVLQLPSGELELECEGRWQRSVENDEMVLSGIEFRNSPVELVEALWDVVLDAAKQLARFLMTGPDLRHLSLEDAMGLAQVTRFLDVTAGHSLYRQDTSSPGDDSIFILSRGSVVLQLRVRDAIETPIERLGPGQVFGGLPMLAGLPHAESAIVDTDSRLFEIDRKSFTFLRMAKPWLAHHLAHAVNRAYARLMRRVITQVRDQL